MQHPIEVVAHQHIGGVLDPALNPLGALRDGVGVTCRQVIQDDSPGGLPLSVGT